VEEEIRMLEAALVDVRKAYLLLHAYQKRLLDTCRSIGDRLRCDFYQTVYHAGRAPASSSRPFQGFDWSMLPLYHFSLLFLPPSELADPNVTKANDWMFEVRIISDSTYVALNGNWKKEPSWTKDPKDGKSSLVLYAFQSTADLKRNWYWDVYLKSKWPVPQTLVRDDGKSTAIYAMAFEISQFLDKEAVDEAVSKFATAMAENLGITMPTAIEDE
jgi:hypothetical protein